MMTMVLSTIYRPLAQQNNPQLHLHHNKLLLIYVEPEYLASQPILFSINYLCKWLDFRTNALVAAQFRFHALKQTRPITGDGLQINDINVTRIKLLRKVQQYLSANAESIYFVSDA